MTISVCDLSMPVRVIAAVYVFSHFARYGSQHSSWIAVAVHVGMHQIRGSVSWTLGFRISVGVISNTDPFSVAWTLGFRISVGVNSNADPFSGSVCRVCDWQTSVIDSALLLRLALLFLQLIQINQH